MLLLLKYFTVLFIAFICTTIGQCNYANMNVKVENELNAGTFTLSTDRCQSLKAKFHVSIFEFSGDGSIFLRCMPTTNVSYELEVEIYADVFCHTSVSTKTIEEGESVSLPNNLAKFTLENLVCSYSASCDVEMAVSRNCSWEHSDIYSNISVPQSNGTCLTLNDKFSSSLSSIPSQILPTEMFQSLNKGSFQFDCCSSDNSLLISNYSDVQCSSKTDMNYIRIPSKYAGRCFVLNDEQTFFDMNEDQNKANSDEVNDDNTYAVVLDWHCSEMSSVDCENDIEIISIDADTLPNECPSGCLNGTYVLNSNANNAETSHSNSSSMNILLIIVIVLCVIVFLFILLFIGYQYYRRQQMVKSVAINLSTVVNSAPAISLNKYEQMLVEDEDVQIGNVETTATALGNVNEES